MNKPRLIDANELLKAMSKRYREIENHEEFHTSDEFVGIAKGFTEVDYIINNLPTAFDFDGMMKDLERMKCKPMSLVYDVPFINGIIETIKSNCSEFPKGSK